MAIILRACHDTVPAFRAEVSHDSPQCYSQPVLPGFAARSHEVQDFHSPPPFLLLVGLGDMLRRSATVSRLGRMLVENSPCHSSKTLYTVDSAPLDPYKPGALRPPDPQVLLSVNSIRKSGRSTGFATNT